MKKFILYAILILAIFKNNSVSGQVVNNVYPKFGKGIIFIAPDTSMSLKFNARFQTLLALKKPLIENADIEREMMIRRARLKFEGFLLTPRLEYKIELALSNKDNGKVIKQGGEGANIVLDAVAKYEAFDNLEIWFGQTKLPGNRERVISSQALQFVDRSLVNSLFTLDRDLGVQVHHKFNVGQAVFKDRYAISMGEGRNITEADTGGLSYTGRIEFLPFGEFIKNGDYFDADLVREPTPKVSLAAGYSYNNNAVKSGGELGSFLKESRDLKTFFADFMLKYRGWSVTSEYMNKQSDRNSLLSDTSNFFQTGSGWNIQSGYLFKNNFEIAARYTVVNPSKNINLASQIVELKGFNNLTKEYTVGVSKYFKGHFLKIQTDASYIDEEGADGVLRYRFQVEVGF